MFKLGRALGSYTPSMPGINTSFSPQFRLPNSPIAQGVAGLAGGMMGAIGGRRKPPKVIVDNNMSESQFNPEYQALGQSLGKGGALGGQMLPGNSIGDPMSSAIARRRMRPMMGGTGSGMLENK